MDIPKALHSDFAFGLAAASLAFGICLAVGFGMGHHFKLMGAGVALGAPGFALLTYRAGRAGSAAISDFKTWLGKS